MPMHISVHMHIHMSILISAHKYMHMSIHMPIHMRIPIHKSIRVPIQTWSRDSVASETEYHCTRMNSSHVVPKYPARHSHEQLVVFA